MALNIYFSNLQLSGYIQTGDRIEGYLNGKKLLEHKDSVFPEEGGVGVWTKADAVTNFDDYKVTSSK